MKLIYINSFLLMCFFILTGCAEKNEIVDVNLPDGYTLDSYTVEKELDQKCVDDTDCETPPEYLIQSRCPFTTKCIEKKCTVVCPGRK